MVKPTANGQIIAATRCPGQPRSLVEAASPRPIKTFAIHRSTMGMPGWKRALDLTLIGLTCPVWLPLMLVVMVAIKISSPGPVFYRQERIGFRGRPFMIYKFRSMKMHAQTSQHELYLERLMRSEAPMTKLDAGDARIIPGGRVLRAAGLDELPQIFNILRGEMSLVGPRPCTSIELQRCQEWQRKRVGVSPGLTGYWQVNGKNGSTFRQMIEMDLFYAKNRSLSFDLWVVLMTPVTLVGQMWELVQQSAVADLRPRRTTRADELAER